MSISERDAANIKPRVVHLVGSFDQGGSERQAVQIARLLKESSRYDVRLVCSRSGGALEAEAHRAFDSILEYPLTSFYDANALYQLRRFSTALRRDRIAILQTHDFYTNVFGMVAARVAGVPVRIAARRETGGVRTPAQKIAERWAYGLAHAIVANAKAVGDQLSREGVPPRKVAVVYNGLDMRRIRPEHSQDAALRALGLDAQPHRRFVTIVANLRFAVKGHTTFLRAAQRVASAVPDAGFLLAGEGELLESMRAFAHELGLGARAIFLGRCDHVGDLLATSDVCVLSSTSEGFPNAIIEYMAAGKPVVATDVGGIREAVEENRTGFLVPAGNDELMAARIIELLLQPERARNMGRIGRQTVEHRFSSQAQLSNTEQLYERLMHERRVSTASGHFR